MDPFKTGLWLAPSDGKMGSMQTISSLPENDVNVVEMWVRKDPVRLIAGALAGVLAALIALVFAMVISSGAGLETTFPAKLFASILVGTSATEHASGMGIIVLGIAFVSILSAISAAVFAHFTYTNKLSELLMMGLVWGVFTWIFVWCLFLPSFDQVLWAKISAGWPFFICLLFGASLSSVKFIYGALGGKVRV